MQLHTQLERDCIALDQLPLCVLLLMNDARFPWFVLVPDRENVEEIYQLNAADRAQLWRESDALSRAIVAVFSPHKLNIAALGNIVPQLHVHHVARFRTDVAWPKPVWGSGAATPYDGETVDEIRCKLRRAFDSGLLS